MPFPDLKKPAQPPMPDDSAEESSEGDAVSKAFAEIKALLDEKERELVTSRMGPKTMEMEGEEE